MANNTLSEDITKTINDIITEVNEFKKHGECILTGSTALYLFVYSLYVNNKDETTRAFIKSQLEKLPNPNDIDIITTQPMSKDKLINYIGKNGKVLGNLSDAKGIPIKRKAGSLYSIDLIIDTSALTTYEIDIPYGDKIIKQTIIHPQSLLIKLYPYKAMKSRSGYNSNSNINEAPLNNVKGMNIKTKKAKKKTENEIKSEVLKAINDYGLIPVLEKQADKRKRTSGNEGKASFRSRLNFGSPSNTKKAMSRLLFN